MSIARMLHVTIIGRTADAEDTLSAVQAVGLLHVTAMRPPEEIVSAIGHGDGLLDLVARLKRARAAIASVVEAPAAERRLPVDELGIRVCAELDRREELRNRLNTVQATVAALSPWGEIDPADLDALAEHGARITFLRLTPADFRLVDWSEIPHAIAQKSDHEVYVAAFGKSRLDVFSTPIRLPRMRLSQAVAERDTLTAELRALERTLGSHARRLPEIDHRLDELGDRAEVLTALGTGLDEGPLYAVSGYIPAENQSDLQRALLPFSAALMVDDPEPGSVVPVKLRHPGPVAGFGAIVREFSGISYWEKDFTPIVMALFMVFGALCLIDAGYGLLLLATGIVLLIRGNRNFGTVFAWTGVLGIAVGVLGGQYFGFVIGRDVLLDQAAPTPLAADPMAAFLFSLAVGMATMTLAYATAIWQRGLGTFATGSLLIALGAIALVVSQFGAEPATTLVLSNPKPWQIAEVELGVTIASAFLGGTGLLAWLIFPDPVFGKRAHIPNILWTLYSGLTGLGQDIMSHMRLFGIALSGAIMASVINTLAGMLPLAAAIPVAIIGHLFVFVLALLSLYIHTNRLIFLEFGSKCFEGGHAWYEPLRSRRASRGPSA